MTVTSAAEKDHNPLLEAHNLHKFFKDVKAVRNVSLKLFPGQITALVGASGSGKSTLLNLLAGLTDADEGLVTLNGIRVPGPQDKLVAGHPDIRLVHQEYQLMPNVTVRENIQYALRYYQKEYQAFRISELLRLCRLEAVADRLPRQISGGEKQRTAIARALAEPATDGRTVTLLLDEPFSHLDLPNRNHIRDLLLDLVRSPAPADQSFACLFVTHDATDALALADTLGVMQAGKIIQLGPPVTLYRQPSTPYVAQLTGPANVLRGKHLAALGLSLTANPEQVVCIRPEYIHLTSEGTTGVVKAVLFRGGYYELLLDINRYVRLQLFTNQQNIQIGDSVRVNVQPEGLWYFKGLSH